jgi:hypothetical protein
MNWLANFVAVSTVLAVALPVSAQTCVPFQVVGGRGVEVEKEVSFLGTGIVRSNWNTDFRVPNDQAFSRYVATILPADRGEYQVRIVLKYADKTHETVYDNVIELPQNQLVLFNLTPRPNQPLDQVNLLIGGVNAIGKSYTVSVLGCN